MKYFVAVVFTLLSTINAESYSSELAAPQSPWKSHMVRQLNGKAGEIKLPAQLQILTESWNRRVYHPYLVYMPEKERLLLVLGCELPHPVYGAMQMFSDDRGTTWSKPRYLHVDGQGKPDIGLSVGLTYFGDGKLTTTDGPPNRRVSKDYGETWSTIPTPSLPNGKRLEEWAPLLVDKDSITGKVTRIVGSCFSTDKGEGSSAEDDGPWQGYIRFSADEGQTWTDAVKVPQWKGFNEVAIIRAQNGDIVAACRTDLPTGKERELDHNCGLGVSISTDNGYTWSKMNMLYEFGRHHPSMVLLPNADIVMTYVVRLGYKGTPEGFPQFGIEAVVSHDHGKTWDLDHRYLLTTWSGAIKGSDAYWASSHTTSSVLLPDGFILTVFGTGYRVPPDAKSPGPMDVGLIRWQVNNEGLNSDQTVTQAPFDSDLRNQFDASAGNVGSRKKN